MKHVTTLDGVTISFDVFGSGPPLVLVHGVFTNRVSNWITVRDALGARFTVHAVDRRGRGETSSSPANSTRDEFDDVAAVVRSVGESVFMIGHSYGAHVALGAASLVPERVRKLILYEPPAAESLSDETQLALEGDARRADWDSVVSRFFRDVALLPSEELETIRNSPVWGMLVDGAKPTMSDLQAFRRYDFDAREFSSLSIPVTFLCGSESPPIQFVTTEALMKTLPDARRLELAGQGHDGMYGDPQQFVDEVTRLLLG